MNSGKIEAVSSAKPQGSLGLARSYRELVVYQRARKVAQDIFTATRSFPQEERYSLTDQVRRSSRSVGAQIAEAWGKRRYPKHFASKLTDADGERLETQHWLDSAVDCGLLAADRSRPLLSDLEEIGRMLNSMILKAEQFVPSVDYRAREEAAEYLVAMDVLPS